MLKGLLEKGANKALEVWLQNKFGDYADIKSVNLDTTNNACHACFTLHGDSEEIVLSVTEFAIQKNENANVFKVINVKCSKVWADNLAQKYLAGKEYELPALLNSFI